MTLSKNIKLNFNEFYKIICYPKYSKEEFERRLNELKDLGISELIEEGEVLVNNFKVLGKGTNSIVVKAIYKGFPVALKIRRVDSSRESLEEEAKILMKVNQINLGPKLFCFTKNFLVLEYIKGIKIGDFIKIASVENLKDVIIKILEQCRKLDSIGIDHGELSRADNHIIILENFEVKIIDFESSSYKRKCKNLTSIISYLFLKNNNLLSKLNIEKNVLIDLLKLYKKSNNEKIYYKILELIKPFNNKN